MLSLPDISIFNCIALLLKKPPLWSLCQVPSSIARGSEIYPGYDKQKTLQLAFAASSMVSILYKIVSSLSKTEK